AQQALLAIKDLILEDPSNVLRTWNKSAHFCEWQGVTCGPWHQRVISLKLASLGLGGSLSPQVGRLTFLRTINLSNNSFRGQIPQEIGQLFQLQHLVLSNNFFEGELPISLAQCTEIRSIRLSHNRLRGNIPTDLSSWSKLRVLDLSANHFNWTIQVLETRQLRERNNELTFSPAEGNTPPEAQAPSSGFPYIMTPWLFLIAEYGMGAQASTHGDVYSFGILLIEMFVGKRPTDVMFTDNLNIQQFTKMAHPDRVLDIMDSQLRLEMERLCVQCDFCKMTECMVWILQIGITCTAEQPRERMDISAVLKGLHIIRNVLLECMRKKERYGEERM
ncbi:Leucine-rich repeat, partial [Dillenia turbinata]